MTHPRDRGMAMSDDGHYRDCVCAADRTCHDCDPCSIAVARSNDGAFPPSPPCRIDRVLASTGRIPPRPQTYNDPMPSPAWYQPQPLPSRDRRGRGIVGRTFTEEGQRG